MKTVSNEKYIQILEQNNAELKHIIKKQQEDIEKIVEQRTRELIDLISTKDKFYRIIAHELRNPFNSILGILELLLNNFHGYEPKEIENFLNILYSTTNISFDLLVNLSEWLSVHNKKLSFNPEEVNVSNLLSEAILTTNLTAQQKNINVNNCIPENIYAYVDVNMVGTIFRNLLNNAIKFSNKKGSIEVSAQLKNEFIEITVKDNGVGLSVETLQNIFKSEGIDSIQGTDQEYGTGFGLLLCKELVEIEGGQIWVESIIGKGSEFKFTIPNSKTY
ncbi:MULTISPECIES: sensor histidine kinase [Carboxylicivirga]|uniref:histidine kinase n=1 Tax=Carboxylicivirga linearis TaxID=1628157 RepID=A0ABS5K0U6_9BACT|nr:HAMP domain-containing sensor histidine kinase [Carboxylicivirga linearis]MBS2100733.1 HAMP domain-containing histidine kinase [Carboxylicivirga linearis]MCU4163845.1 HAMP domain-containing histidine kinase [Marinilabiliaceae bacterium A049]